MTKSIDTLLSEALLRKKLVSREKLAELSRKAAGEARTLRDILIEQKVCSEDEILAMLAEGLGLARVELKDLSLDKSLLHYVPLKIASYYKFLPLKLEGRILTIAVSVPLDLKTQDEIRMQLGFDIVAALACEREIIEGMKRLYGLAADTLDKIHAADQNLSAQPQKADDIDDIGRQAEDASVIKIVNQIIVDAFRRRSTDIHIEPFRDTLSLRYRIDGMLYDANIPDGMYGFLNAIISRVKIMSNLNIVERRLPQDGRAVVKVQEQVIDLRISTIPTPHGESIVIRILPTKMLFSLERLGLIRNDLLVFEELLRKPHGIIFVTGPTGSGKTTTLYACLSRINTKERKIITIEDPIEYEMQGITQIQVNSETGLDFARGLRSMLRHDPDVMMVGEVRDLETAEIAIRVALTGHLVFSTLHTNDAVSGVTRLVDIGVEPYLLSSSVEAFIAQRLVRLICPECRYEDESAPIQLKEMIAQDMKMDSTEPVHIYRAKGCPNCNFTGYFGRTAIYEILLVNDELRDMIMQKAPANQLLRSARAHGMRTLRQDGWQKVLAGKTTPEEVMKVTAAEETIARTAAETVPMPQEDQQQDWQERRLFRRLPQTINVKYRVVRTVDSDDTAHGQAEYRTASRNISAGGILFVAAESVPVSSILEITLELPDGKAALQCLAKVVRADQLAQEAKFDIAVCFLDLSGSQRSRLKQYVDTF